MVKITPPIYHEHDLNFIHETLEGITFHKQWIISRWYSVIILREMGYTERSIGQTNKARKKANTWLRKQRAKYDKDNEKAAY